MTNIDVKLAAAFLADYLDTAPTAVILLGEGAWSRCFGFHRGAEDLVIRFGKYVDDFMTDQRAAAYASPDLPIPQVLEIDTAFDGYYAISTRVHGIPLESVNAAQWQTLVPALAAALEALRTADISGTTGFGGWGATGNAPSVSWSEHLLAVGEDRPALRTAGWRKKLATSPQAEAAFTWGFDLLRQVVSDAVPRCLLHCDLINRNVLVQDDKISGVFDWGCSRYGDHLYELAWFDFWSPWYPELNLGLLHAELERRWQAAGYVPSDKAARLTACYLHIGLDHLAYNSYTGDEVNLVATAERMRTLASRG